MWQSKLIHQFQKQFSNAHTNINHHLIDSIYENTIYLHQYVVICYVKLEMKISNHKYSLIKEALLNSVLSSLLYDVF